MARGDGFRSLGAERTQPAQLLGRRSERAVLDQLLSDVRGGRSRVLVIRGEAGVGKTALLTYATESTADVSTLRAVGVQSEMELPFAALHQLCAPLRSRSWRSASTCSARSSRWPATSPTRPHCKPRPTRSARRVVKWTDLATQHPADLVLYDQRPNSLGTDRLAGIPGWSEVPGVRTGKVLAWDPEPPLTYTAAAAFVTSVADHH